MNLRSLISGVNMWIAELKDKFILVLPRYLVTKLKISKRACIRIFKPLCVCCTWIMLKTYFMNYHRGARGPAN